MAAARCPSCKLGGFNLRCARAARFGVVPWLQAPGCAWLFSGFAAPMGMRGQEARRLPVLVLATCKLERQLAGPRSEPGLQEQPARDSEFWRGSPCGALRKVACVLRCRAARAGGWHRALNGGGVFFRSSFGT